MKMLRIVIVLTVALCWLATGAAWAADAHAADHEALRALMKTAATAINTQDVKILEACLAKNFVFTTVDQTALTNRAGVAAYYDRMFRAAEAPLSKMEIKPQADILTQFIAPDAGYCYGSSVESYTLKDGKIFTFHTRWTALVIREDGQWKAAALHAGINFLDNPVLEARSLSFWKKLGIFLHLVKPPYDIAK
ncbi:MAG: nuclear transport factor 2 family protein [Kiritimatiellaeota bacterium]|nr:nuclear transport factor 2 family protein [Kiritimatiellota bacterium]